MHIIHSIVKLQAAQVLINKRLQICYSAARDRLQRQKRFGSPEDAKRMDRRQKRMGEVFNENANIIKALRYELYYLIFCLYVSLYRKLQPEKHNLDN
jgi:hypothetical protein